MNLFDYFEQVVDGASAPWAARAPRQPTEQFDLLLMPRTPAWQDDACSLRVLEQLEREPWVDSVACEQDRVMVRLDDRWVQRTGASLEAGGSSESDLADLACSQRFAIQFWDPNATKALHAGHLRNLALGNALASSLQQAGATVERRSLISDAGRSMGEAMAGIRKSNGHAESALASGLKSDHYVGRCYAAYVMGSAAQGANAATTAPEDSQTRELTVRHDDADELLREVLRGDTDARELWRKTRGWVIAGQRATLGRLAIRFDRVFFESDFIADSARLTEQGLSEGRLERRPDGVVTYMTGVEELEEMPLVRADGISTQHLRAVTYWLMAPGLEDITTIQISGTEWVAHATCIEKLMGELKAPPASGDSERPVHPIHDVFHGMVSRQKHAIASSAEGALLIDDLLDEIDLQIDADPRMREVRQAQPAPERLAAQIALAHFLPYPAVPPAEFEPEKLLRDGQSLGWDMARARARPANDTDAARLNPAEDPNYRFAVVQSELHRRHLRLAVERFDITPIAVYLGHLARWRLEGEHSAHVARVVQTLLDRGASALGL
jgi:arginyl-tRNA synthetase